VGVPPDVEETVAVRDEAVAARGCREMDVGAFEIVSVPGANVNA
jgi:hypothetical protein